MPSLSSNCIVLFFFCTYPSWTCTHHISLYLCTMTPASAPRSWFKKIHKKTQIKVHEKATFSVCGSQKKRPGKRSFLDQPLHHHAPILPHCLSWKKTPAQKIFTEHNARQKKNIFWIQFSQIQKNCALPNTMQKSYFESNFLRFQGLETDYGEVAASLLIVDFPPPTSLKPPSPSPPSPPSQKSELQSFL